jgi:hypothetical protein
MGLVDQVKSQLMIARTRVGASQTGGLTVELPYVPEQASQLLVLHNGKVHAGASLAGQTVTVTGTFALNDALDVVYPKALWEGLAALAAKGAAEGASRTVEMAQVDVVETFTTWLSTTLSALAPGVDTRLTALETRMAELAPLVEKLGTHTHSVATAATETGPPAFAGA